MAILLAEYYGNPDGEEMSLVSPLMTVISRNNADSLPLARTFLRLGANVQRNLNALPQLVATIPNMSVYQTCEFVQLFFDAGGRLAENTTVGGCEWLTMTSPRWIPWMLKLMRVQTLVTGNFANDIYDFINAHNAMFPPRNVRQPNNNIGDFIDCETLTPRLTKALEIVSEIVWLRGCAQHLDITCRLTHLPLRMIPPVMWTPERNHLYPYKAQIVVQEIMEGYMVWQSRFNSGYKTPSPKTIKDKGKGKDKRREKEKGKEKERDKGKGKEKGKDVGTSSTTSSATLRGFINLPLELVWELCGWIGVAVASDIPLPGDTSILPFKFEASPERQEAFQRTVIRGWA